MQMRFDDLALFDRRELRLANDDEPAPRTPDRVWESTEGLSRLSLVEQILEINHTATLEFLNEFSDQDLSNYLNHLLYLQQPRTGLSRWVRPGDSPAVMARSRDY